MADIAEEVGRSYGYNEIPTTAFKTSTQGGYSPLWSSENKTGVLCRGLGFSEIITYSFVSPGIFDQIRLPKDSPPAECSEKSRTPWARTRPSCGPLPCPPCWTFSPGTMPITTRL